MRYPSNPEQERAAVAKGAALLDKILPGWYNEINLNTLEMDDGSMCMMGQLFGAGIESDLAREMYPKEMEEITKDLELDEWGMDDSEGYNKALQIRFHKHSNFIKYLMKKHGVDRKMAAHYTALYAVCDGHDTKCFWAEAIAERKANDAIYKKEETKAPARTST